MTALAWIVAAIFGAALGAVALRVIVWLWLCWDAYRHPGAWID